MTYYRFGNKKGELYVTRESFCESVASDIFMTACNIFILYLSHKYFGNEWLPCLILFLITIGILIRSNEKHISKKEFIKMIERDIQDD